MIYPLNYNKGSLLIMEGFRRGIPIEQSGNILLLVNEAYLLGRKDAESKRKELSNGELSDERDCLAIRNLDSLLIEKLTLEAKRIGVSQEFISAFLRTADSSYLFGYADKIMGMPQNGSRYALDFGILFKIAHANEPTTIQ